MLTQPRPEKPHPDLPHPVKRLQEITDNKKLRSREKRGKFLPPSPEEVLAYAEEIDQSDFDSNQFCDFYESKGWMVGKNKMKSWKAAVRSWLNRELKPKTIAPHQLSENEILKECAELDISTYGKSKIELIGQIRKSRASGA